ncbi:MAG: selenocysteine-specific translation elongation factor [Gemmatimonadetes bacterium]|nr:MAG: selenocysteine-specific translation elongation factor [Gemmatimonadota bacterium]
MKHIIIGTAGHIDHGKTELVRRLTGINTDRLKEEQDRGISIDIGFARLQLPSGIHAGIVDMPGHERFIKNMLAGATGIDLVLLVVAADEGVMPQTTEHLDILRLLEIQRGIVVLTKSDLIDDPDWLELIKDDIYIATQGTFLNRSPVIAVSAVTGMGIEELRAALDREAQEIIPRRDSGAFRLPIDRSFTVTGTGTVVTGTCWSGRVNVGDTLTLLPKEKEVRVRSIQVHGEQVESAAAGQRVALAIHGVDHLEIHRGCVLVQPGQFQMSYMLDARFKLLPTVERALKQRTRIRFHLGTNEVLGRISLLERDSLIPGEDTLVQIRLENPVIAARGDRYVIRSYSPLRTIGGGMIIDPNPRKHKSADQHVLSVLRTLEKGDPQEIIEQKIYQAKYAGITPENVARELGLHLPVVHQEGKTLITQNIIIPIGKIWLHSVFYREVTGTILSQLKTFHQQFALRWGMPKAALSKALPASLSPQILDFALKALMKQGSINIHEDKIQLVTHQITFSPTQEKLRQHLEQFCRDAGFTPPEQDHLYAKFGDDPDLTEILTALIDSGRLIKITSKLITHADVVEEGKRRIEHYLTQHDRMTMSDAKTLLDETSRKYSVPFLEYYDKIGLTYRIGDQRVLVQS